MFCRACRGPHWVWLTPSPSSGCGHYPHLALIIAEGRYVSDGDSRFADLAFVVDEAYQRMGIAGYLYRLLIRIAKENDIEGFTADVLASNRPMMKVFQSGREEITSKVEDDVYRLTIRFAH